MEASTAPASAAVTTTEELPEQQQDQLHTQRDQQQQQQQQPLLGTEATATASAPQTYNAFLQLAHLIGQSSPTPGSDQVSNATQPAMALESQVAQLNMAHLDAAHGQLSPTLPASAEPLEAAATGLLQTGVPELEPSYMAAESQGHLQGVSTSCLDATQLRALGLIPDGSYVGLVKSFNPIKGFGFITSQAVEGDLFFLRTELPPEIQSGDVASLQGRTVAFDLRSGEGGRARAGRVQLLPTDGQPAVGTIKSYSERNGYGFISTSSLSRDVHFKTSDMPPELHACTGVELAGKRVIFQVEVLKDGKLKAMQLQLAASLEPQVVPPRLAVPAAVTALGGTATGGSCNSQEKGQLRGFVTTYDAIGGTGILQAPGVADALRFNGLGLELVPGQQVSFILHWFPDGTAEARGVALVANLPQNDELFNGAVLTGKVKSFHELKGFGFINVPNQVEDLYFQRRDLAVELQMHMQQGAPLIGSNVWFRLEATPYGRWHARCVGLEPPTAQTEALQLAVENNGLDVPAVSQLADGLELMGTVKTYAADKGLGIINVPGQPIDIYFQTQDLADPVADGTVVHFLLQATLDGRWQARSIRAMQQPGGVNFDATLQGTALQGAALQGTALQGTALQGTALQGTALQSTALQSTVLQSTALQSTMWPTEVTFLDGAAAVGSVKSFNESKGYGFINVAGNSTDIYFQPADFSHDGQLQLQQRGGAGCLVPGTVVNLFLQQLPEGRWRAREIWLQQQAVDPTAILVAQAQAMQAPNMLAKLPLIVGTPAAAAAAISAGQHTVLNDGAELMGKVKSYSESKGYGFINVSGEVVDLYFQTRDLTPDTRHQLSQGISLSGAVVCFWLQALPDGRCGKWRARDVSLAAESAAGEVTSADGKRSAAVALDPIQLTAGAPPLKQQRWDVLEALPGMTAMTAGEALPGISGMTSVAALPSMTAVEALPGMAVGTTQVGGAIPPPPPPAPAAAVADLVSGACPMFVPPRLMSGTSEPTTTARFAGTIKSFNTAKGFGFIACQVGAAVPMTSAQEGVSEDIFFLRSELPGGLATGHAEQGQLCGFDLQLTPEGRYRAARISFE